MVSLAYTILGAKILKFIMVSWFSVRRWRVVVATFCLAIAVEGCTTARPTPAGASAGAAANPSSGFFVPTEVFDPPGGAAKRRSQAANDAKTAPAAAVNAADVPQPPPPLVFLYASPTTRAYFSAGGLDAETSTRVWTVFLRKYKIPFQMLTSLAQLEKAQHGVLLLPSAVALSEREKQAVTAFRAKGGGVLASWLTGVRNENGEWRGFDFMESALDVKVVGNTQADENDIFLMPFGDSPVTHNLPSGLRVWLERAKEWYPLRLLGPHPAAQIMDWSRTVVAGKPSAAIVFNERNQSSGLQSRSVVLGYPERLWLSSDPKLLEAIAHNALMWLLRQPAAYTSAWPYPYASALVLAVDSADVFIDADLNFAKSVEEAGGRATYYVLTENAVESVDMLKKLKARGHEIAYLGDRYEGFMGQSSDAQAKRLDAMRNEMRAAGVEVAMDAGFHAPAESYDKVTERLLMERGFGHYVAFVINASDARLPFFAAVDAGAGKPANSLVVLPRTQGGPEDSVDDSGPENVLRTYLAELDLAEQMAALSVVRMPNQSVLGAPELAVFFKDLKARRGRMWMATAGQTVNWWRERQRVSVSLEPLAAAPLLTVTINGDTPLQQAVTVLVNLPAVGSALRLVARDGKGETPKIVSVDNWRAAVVLQGLAPGIYHWSLHFDRPATGAAK